MDVGVAVIEPVIVIALVNGNDTVGVIDTVDDYGSINFVNIATRFVGANRVDRWHRKPGTWVAPAKARHGRVPWLGNRRHPWICASNS